MIRIDFLGAAGVGKSTTFSHIKQTDALLRSGTAAYVAAGRAQAAHGAIGWKRRMKWRIPRLGKALREAHLSNVIYRGEATAFARFAEQNEAFLAVAHESYAHSERSAYIRAEGCIHFLRTVRRIAFLEDWLDDEVVLFDESLSQKVYAVMPWHQNNEAQARRYFEHMPLPAALIHLEADSVQVLSQIRKRQRDNGKLIPRHRGLTDDELMLRTVMDLKCASIGAETLQARGCHVLSLSASNSPMENAHRVAEFISEVAS